MKLFYSRYTRASRPRQVLEEIGAPHELVRLDMKAGDHKKPAYLAIHPHGLVPALQDGGVTIIESSAICQYIAEKYPDSGLVPMPGSAHRADLLQWVAYLSATVEPTVIQFSTHARGMPEENRVPRLAEDAMGKLRQQSAVLTRALGGREWICGSFTIADIIGVSLLSWAGSMGMLAEQPALLDWVARGKARPAWKRATQD